MTNVTGAEAGGPSFHERRGPEIKRTKEAATKAWANEAQRRLSEHAAQTTTLTPAQENALSLSVLILSVPREEFPSEGIDIPKKKPGEGSDLSLGHDYQYQDAGGQQQTLDAGKGRISKLGAVDPQNPDNIMVSLMDDNGQPIPGDHSLPRTEVHASLVAAASDTYATLIPQDVTGDVLRADLAIAIHERGQGPEPVDLPSQAVTDLVLQTAQAPATEPDEPEDEIVEKTPLQKAEAIIEQQIERLVELLQQNPPPAELKEKKQRKAAQDLLVILKLAEAAKGKLGTALVTKALRDLRESPLKLGEEDELSQTIDGIQPEAKAANDNIRYRIKTQPGLKDQDRDALLALVDTEGLGALLKDKRMQQLDTVIEGLFGTEEPDFKKFLKNLSIPPELQKEVDAAIKGGTSILKIILMIAAGILVAPVLAVGAVPVAVATGVGGPK